MAMESSTQYERDLRSASKPWKRGRDAHAKWAHGSRPLHGCTTDMFTGETRGGSEAQRAKTRPGRAEVQHHSKKHNNIVKITWHNYEQPHHLARTTISAREELADADSRSIVDMLPSPPVRQPEAAPDGSNSGVLYSFESTETPGKPLALDVFVKATGRETERLVEREYQVLDENGDLLKGRKARRNLRQSGSPTALPSDGSGASAVDEAIEEDDGFELI